MVRPIPIFKFAFAAYAAAFRNGSEAPTREKLKPQLFEATWRSAAAGAGVLLVKIDALDNGCAVTGEPTPFETTTPIREVWLGQIQETESGYSGVVCPAQAPLGRIGAGERIAFGSAHVRDWTICGESALDRAGATPAPEIKAACDYAEEARR